MRCQTALFRAYLLGLCIPFVLCAQRNPPSEGREVTKLYAEQCASCHGADMNGASGPTLLQGVGMDASVDASLTQCISDGHGAMPAMRQTISRAEIRALVVYIHEKRTTAEREHAKFDAPAPGVIVQSEKAAYKLEAVIESGLAEPWAIAFLPDGRMLVTERPGRLRIVEKGRLLPEPVRGTPAVYGGEGGLLDVALSPNYAKPGNDWVYLTYGDKSPDGNAMTAVVRGRLRNGEFVDQQQIFKADYALYRAGGQRFGSRLLFDGKGHLFFSIGDRAAPGDEQDLSRPNGKIHRVMEDGTIPKDNPFVHTPGALPSIWSYGHRNPQGLAFDPVTGELWETEHGPRGGDELNIIRRGHNYGWPVITYGINYDGTPITDHLTQEGMDQPVSYWVPSIAASPIAFYTGNRLAGWHNSLLVGSLATEELRRVPTKRESAAAAVQQEILFKGIGRVRDVVNGPDGYLYVVLDQPDRIVRIAPGEQSVK